MIEFSFGRSSVLAMVLTLVSSPLLEAAAAPKSVFKAGFAERDISPAVGMEQPGGYGKAYHQSFHDPWKVRAAVFDDGRARVAIVGIDALFIRRQTVQSIRTAIQKKCGIEPHSILISASHTHSGGPIGYYLPGEFDEASPLVRSLAYDRTVCANPGISGQGRARDRGGRVRGRCPADRRPRRAGIRSRG
jgi:neutral ceramidase